MSVVYSAFLAAQNIRTPSALYLQTRYQPDADEPDDRETFARAQEGASPRVPHCVPLAQWSAATAKCDHMGAKSYGPNAWQVPPLRQAGSTRSGLLSEVRVKRSPDNIGRANGHQFFQHHNKTEKAHKPV